MRRSRSRWKRRPKTRASRAPTQLGDSLGINRNEVAWPMNAGGHPPFWQCFAATPRRAIACRARIGPSRSHSRNACFAVSGQASHVATLSRKSSCWRKVSRRVERRMVIDGCDEDRCLNTTRGVPALLGRSLRDPRGAEPGLSGRSEATMQACRSRRRKLCHRGKVRSSSGLLGNSPAELGSDHRPPAARPMTLRSALVRCKANFIGTLGREPGI